MRRASALAAATACALVVSAASEARPATPIEHFVVLMQENHSFDNYFGTYPGANGIPKGTCMPVGPTRPSLRPAVPPRRPARAQPQSRSQHQTTPVRRGADGRLRAGRVRRAPGGGAIRHGLLRRPRPAPLLEPRGPVRPLRSVLCRSGCNERRQSPGLGERVARPAGQRPCPPTIFDRLEERGISWKFYVEDYDPSAPDQATRVPLLRYPRFVNEPKLFDRIVDLEEYYDDLRADRLPQVAYIAPAGSSEHPPSRIATGETLVKRLVTALSMSDAWPSSAFMWAYDEPGGWFDHVRPPKMGGVRLGLRVPALLVSPYARRGYVDSTTLDTTAILRFIEDNWRLERLAPRPGRMGTIAGAFDFSQPPREPSIAATERDSSGPAPVRRWVIYLGYGAALLLAVTLAGWAALRRPATVGAAAVVALVLMLEGHPAAAQSQERAAAPSTVRTVPAVPGMRFEAAGVRFTADRRGVAHPPPGARAEDLRALGTEIEPGVRARFDRWYRGRAIAAINRYHRVRTSFVDPSGTAIDPSTVSSVTLRGSDGGRYALRPSARSGCRATASFPRATARSRSPCTMRPSGCWWPARTSSTGASSASSRRRHA